MKIGFQLATVRSLSLLKSDMNKTLTAIIQKEGNGYVALCPEIDVVSQGDSIEAAKDNLREAVELFFECASPAEIDQRFSKESYISSLEVEVA